MVPMPTQIRIGPYDFAVRGDMASVMTAREEGRDQRVGETDTRWLRITVDARLPAGQVRDTLLHEVLHACWYAVGGFDERPDESERDREERYVARLSPVLLDTLRRNAGLAAFLVAPDDD